MDHVAGGDTDMEGFQTVKRNRRASPEQRALSDSAKKVRDEHEPLPGLVYEHTMLFCWSIYGRCRSAEIYTADAFITFYHLLPPNILRTIISLAYFILRTTYNNIHSYSHRHKT